MNEVNENAGASDSSQKPAPRRRRRRWPWVIAVLLLLIVGVIALGPTIASLAPVRGIVVKTVSGTIDGTLTLDNYNVGWFSGTTVTGLKLTDNSQREVLAVPRLSTDVTLLDLVRGETSFGKIEGVISNFVVEVDPDTGRTNFDDILNLDPTDPTAPSDPSKPDSGTSADSIWKKYRAEIDLKFKGSVAMLGQNPQTVQVRESYIRANLDQQLENDVKIVLQSGEAAPATITARGKVDPVTLLGTQDITLTDLELAVLNPILAAAGQELTLAGKADGGFTLDRPDASGNAKGQLAIVGLVASGKMLNGDTLNVGDVTVPIDLQGDPAAAEPTLDVKQLEVQTAYGVIRLNGAIKNGAGDLKLAGTLDKLEQLVAQLPNTLADAGLPSFSSGRIDLGGTVGVDLAASTPVNFAKGVGFKATFTDLLMPAEGEDPPLGARQVLAEATVTSQDDGKIILVPAENPLILTLRSIRGMEALEGKDASLQFVGRVMPGEDRTDVQIDSASATLPQGKAELTGGLAMVGDAINFNKLLVTIPEADTRLELGGQLLNHADSTELQVNLGFENDWPKLKAFAQTLLDPATVETLQTVQLGGRNKSYFQIRGSIPAKTDKPAIAFVQTSGDVQIPQFERQGLVGKDLLLRMTLADGKLTLREGKPDKPVKLNGGVLNLESLSIDLTTDVPRLTTADNHPLLRNATVNPLLSQSYGKFVNPAFANATQAKGLLDITIETCQGLALGELLTSSQSGSAVFIVSLRDMELTNPLGKQMLGAISFLKIESGMGDVFAGEIKDARFELTDGKLKQNLPLSIGDPTKTNAQGDAKLFTLRFTGNVTLDNQFMNLTLTIPQSLLNQWTHDDVAKLFPDGLPLEVTGTTNAPQFNLGASARSAFDSGVEKRVNQEIEKAAGDLFDKLINKKK